MWPPRRGLLLAVTVLVFMLLLCWNLGPRLRFQDVMQGSISAFRAEPPRRQSEGGQKSHPPPVSTFPPKFFSRTARPQVARGTQSPVLKGPTRTAGTRQEAAENVVNARSDDVGKTETTTKAPSLQPKQTAGPTEPPFIGDEYSREDVPLRARCSDAIRAHVNGTEFGARFLKDVPVLQWAKSVTRDAYERLHKYPGAHGWGGIDYRTLEDTLSVLNSSANGRMLEDREDGGEARCVRCAVVGNGGILKDSHKGKEIDGHDYVFRTNGAIITGFEEDVGSRTTHYTFSTNTLMNSMRNYAKLGYRGPPVSKETRYVFLPDHDRDYLLMKAAATNSPVERGHEQGKDPSQLFGKDVSKERLKMYHPDFIRYLRNRFLRSKTLKTEYKDLYRPSTGAVMLLAALHTCDQVSAYGFMTPDYNNYSDHYYDTSYHPVGFFINHDLHMEMSLWQKLHEQHLIQLYMHEQA